MLRNVYAEISKPLIPQKMGNGNHDFLKIDRAPRDELGVADGAPVGIQRVGSTH